MTQEFGRGLYATRKIYANEIVEVAEILVLSQADTVKINETDLKWYTFVFDAAKGQDCIVLGDGEIFNHSDTPNIKYDLVLYGKRFKMVFVSLQDIEVGEQLFTDYNQDIQVETTEYVNKNMIG
jgi:SET domain-containing protein